MLHVLPRQVFAKVIVKLSVRKVNDRKLARFDILHKVCSLRFEGSVMDLTGLRSPLKLPQLDSMKDIG